MVSDIARSVLKVENAPNLRVYPLKAGEAMVIVNAYGINPATIDTALEARRLGLKVIGVTGTYTAEALALDHPSPSLGRDRRRGGTGGGVRP